MVMAYPDLGKFYFRQIGSKPREKHTVIILIGVEWLILHDYSDGCEVSGILDDEDSKFYVTVKTNQPANEVLHRIADYGEYCTFRGTLDTEEVTGDGGEVYRMFVGEFVRLGDA